VQIQRKPEDEHYCYRYLARTMQKVRKVMKNVKSGIIKSKYHCNISTFSEIPYLVIFLFHPKPNKPDHSGCMDYCMNSLHPLKHWGRGFQSHSRHGCFLCIHSVFVLSCVCSSLAKGSCPTQGVLPILYMIKKLQNIGQCSS
jgi:hypothetical protein